MTRIQQKTITVSPDSELSMTLKATAIAGLRALDEALAGVDREQLLRDVYAQPAQDSHGRSV